MTSIINIKLMRSRLHSNEVMVGLVALTGMIPITGKSWSRDDCSSLIGLDKVLIALADG